MRCLITGASGHVGAAITRRFVASGARVFALVRPQSDLWRLADLVGEVQYIRAELRDVRAAAEAIYQAAPEIVVHAAWDGVVRDSRDDMDRMRVNVEGSLELLRLVQEAGCRSWIGIGSQAEYGAAKTRLREDLAARPTTPYGIAKHEVSERSRQFCASMGIRYVWLRLLATYGPMDDARRLIPMVIQHLLDGRIPALTPGKQLWDYLYIDDAAEAVRRVATAETAAGVFNLASGEARTVRSIVEYVRDLIDPSLPLEWGKVEYLSDQTMRLEADVTRLRAATGWGPTVPLEEGLRRTVEWYSASRTLGSKSIS